MSLGDLVSNSDIIDNVGTSQLKSSNLYITCRFDIDFYFSRYDSPYLDHIGHDDHTATELLV